MRNANTVIHTVGLFVLEQMCYYMVFGCVCSDNFSQLLFNPGKCCHQQCDLVGRKGYSTSLWIHALNLLQKEYTYM